MQDQGRRLAALCTILNKSLAELGDNWKVTPGHLVDLKHGRYQIGDRVAGLFQENLGVSTAWLQSGEGKIFVEGRSPGKLVEDAIDRQLELGTPGTGGAPVFGSIKEVQPKGKAGGIWKSYALRGVMPVAASDRRGFYVQIANARDAKIVGCRRNDFALFIRAEVFLRKRKFDDGDEMACILQKGSARWLAKFKLIGSGTKRQRRLGTGFAKPLDGEYDMTHRGKYGTEFYLKQVAPRGKPRIGELIAVAVRAERDLL